MWHIPLWDGAVVMLLKWRDKRNVFMVATNDAGLDEVKRVRRHNVEVDLPVPTCVKRYNGLMGGSTG